MLVVPLVEISCDRVHFVVSQQVAHSLRNRALLLLRLQIPTVLFRSIPGRVLVQNPVEISPVLRVFRLSRSFGLRKKISIIIKSKGPKWSSARAPNRNISLEILLHSQGAETIKISSRTRI